MKNGEGNSYSVLDFVIGTSSLLNYILNRFDRREFLDNLNDLPGYLFCNYDFDWLGMDRQWYLLDRHVVGHGRAVGFDFHCISFLQIALAGVAEDQDALPIEAEMDDAVGGALVGVELAALGGAVGFDQTGLAHVLEKKSLPGPFTQSTCGSGRGTRPTAP